MSDNGLSVRIAEFLEDAKRGSMRGREDLEKEFNELLSDVLRVVNERLFRARFCALSAGVEFNLNDAMYEMIEQAAAGTFIPDLYPDADEE